MYAYGVGWEIWTHVHTHTQIRGAKDSDSGISSD